MKGSGDGSIYPSARCTLSDRKVLYSCVRLLATGRTEISAGGYCVSGSLGVRVCRGGLCYWVVGDRMDCNGASYPSVCGVILL